MWMSVAVGEKIESGLITVPFTVTEVVFRVGTPLALFWFRLSIVMAEATTGADSRARVSRPRSEGMSSPRGRLEQSTRATASAGVGDRDAGSKRSRPMRRRDRSIRRVGAAGVEAPRPGTSRGCDDLLRDRLDCIRGRRPSDRETVSGPRAPEAKPAPAARPRTIRDRSIPRSSSGALLPGSQAAGRLTGRVQSPWEPGRRPEGATKENEMERKASAEWKGGLKDGQGTVSSASGALSAVRYNLSGRLQQGGGPHPQELIPAPHPACFSMAPFPAL